jgi:hypothetical protein
MNLFQLFKSFYNIDQETYELLISAFTTRTFSKGSYLVKPGQIQRNFYFVNKGIQMSSPWLVAHEPIAMLKSKVYIVYGIITTKKVSHIYKSNLFLDSNYS